MDLKSWILEQHDTLDFHYRITAGAVPRERWAERPYPGSNPVWWSIWHISRWSDLAVHVMLRGQEGVYDDAWSARCGLPTAPGTGMSSAEIDACSARVDTGALHEYWLAVHARTREWLTTAGDSDLRATLERPVDVDAIYDRAPDLLPDASAWVRAFQRNKSGSFFLQWVALGHSEWHFGELQTVCAALGYSPEP